jgi:uncharacterized protein YndB with AHSA1/START domain
MSALMNQRARAVADLSQGYILATAEMAAQPERVFRALCTAEVTQWWGSPERYRTTEWIGELRPGGKWRVSGTGQSGKPFSVWGEYVEVAAPHQLVLTWNWADTNPTKLTYRLDAIDGGTRVTLRHEGFAGPPESWAVHARGWEHVLDWLRRHVTAAIECRYFVCRLVPPRPSFAIDMSAAEAEMMQQHAAYWSEKLARGVAIVFGPVADPKGAWGLGLVRAADEAEVRSLRDGDPAIRSGFGFSYEILPMMRAVLNE